MHWIDGIQAAIDFIEENLLEDIGPEDVARKAYANKDYFQKIFSAVTGFSIGEYIRNRRLSLAGRELATGGARVIDVALKYGYETPESFARAFTRFHGMLPSALRGGSERLRTFERIVLQINIIGGFNMSVKLDVRSVGFIDNLKNDQRSPESFALPACLTSLMEYIGEDAGWETIRAHDREYRKRRLYDALLAATGMGFGLLWYEKEACPSSLDLTQVNEDHDETIRRAFAYAGYSCEIVERTDDNYAVMKQWIVESIDAGRPVLGFGVVGPPECSIICGYDGGGDTLFGWSHFQSYEAADVENNGMFRRADWHGGIWKIVLCREKTAPQRDLREIVRHGVAIEDATKIRHDAVIENATKIEDHGDYLAGAAAYDAWVAYVSDPACEGMADEELRGKYWFHSALVGNHAEARRYLGNFLHESAGDDLRLHEIAEQYGQIHDLCRQLWGVGGGLGNAQGYESLRDPAKRRAAAELIRKIEALDRAATEGLRAWAR